MSLSRRSSVRELSRRDPAIILKLTSAQTRHEGDRTLPVFGVAINVSEPGNA